MKSLLRKKTHTDIQKPSPPTPVPILRPPSTIETPLYARFASIKPGVQPQEKTRPTVSGPMPLGRPSRANLEADDNRGKREEAALPRHRPSSGRHGIAPGPQSPPSSGPRNGRSSVDTPHQDVRVSLTQAARQPIKAQTASSSDEQLAPSNPHRATVTESVQHPLPSPPLSPRSSSNSQQVKPTPLYQSQSYSPPSVGTSHGTATEVPAITNHLYREPRYPSSRASESLPSTNINVSISGAMKLNPTEGPHNSSDHDHRSAMRVSLSPNQALHDVKQLQSTATSPHQGAVLVPQSNNRVDGPMRIKRTLPELPPDTQTSQDKLDRRTSRTLAKDPPTRTAGTPPPQDSVYRSMSRSFVTETTPPPFVVTPPQSPEGHVNPARRANTQARGHPRISSVRDPESEPAPASMRRGPLIFASQDPESGPVSHEHESPREVGQRGYQQPQGLTKPLRSSTNTGSPEVGSQLAPHRSLSHSQTYKQEQVKAPQAAMLYEDDAPPVAHPAIRRISRSSAARMQAPQSLVEDRKLPSGEHSRKPGHRNYSRSKFTPVADPASASNLALARENGQSSWQAHLDDDLPVLSQVQPIPGQDPSSSDPSRPPTPPEKSPVRNARSEWSHHIEHQSPSQSLAPSDDVEVESRHDVRKSWAVPIPQDAQSDDNEPPSPNVEDGQEDVQRTFLLDGSSMRESSTRVASSIDGDSSQEAVGQLCGGSNSSVIEPLDSQVDDPAIFVDDPQLHQNITQQPLGDDGKSFVDDIEPVVRPRPRASLTHTSPEEYSRARARRRGTWLEKSVPADIAELAEETKPTFYPLLLHLQNPELLTELLVHLSFYEWLILWGSVSKVIRQALDSDPALCDVALQRYLSTVGYVRWTWSSPEPIRITLAEMHAYMRGVSVPVHVYAQSSLSILSSPPSGENVLLIRGMKKQTRAFNRVVIRLRAQAEAHAEQGSALRRRQSIGSPPTQKQNSGPPLSWSSGAAHGQGPKHRSASRSSSRAPSPTNSAWSQGAGSQVHLPLGSNPTSGGLKSPLFRLRRAPLLRVFVPSPEGDWLSDVGVLECETELRKAGILPLLRLGDVVWDTALGDEGNAGRLVWDGRYLIDLDYTFSQIGDVPPSLPGLAFPPSYFHRVIRVAGDRNPITHIDIRFWGEEILANLQLLQDRVRTETPQGAYHTVVRWVHRSSFTIVPPPGGAPVIILPNRERRVVDSGWRGTVVVEAEGTNEGLADLHARCRGVFQPRAGDVGPPLGERERMIWRVLRERSRPGEIWIRAVNYKERLIP